MKTMTIRLPKSYYNIISYIGTIIAILALILFIFLFLLSTLFSLDEAYTGIILFLVIPAFLIIGLLFIPLGMIRQYKRMKKKGEIPASLLPIVDLNIQRHRNATFIFLIGTVVLLFLSAFGLYEAYHYTESVKFCGTLCHKVMHPEYTAYLKSPHARVTCAECHVGAGANWYVKSKLSGLYQVYATLAKKYPKPIPTPIKNLRPARETCEECHWPQKIYGKQQRQQIYYLADESNSRWEIDLLMNTGGGNPSFGQTTGIHWHINPDISIEYVTNDPHRLEIPKVILYDKKTGQKTIFEDHNSNIEDKNSDSLITRTMDCGDCHNRPSHIYEDPGRFINIALASGNIPDTLPFIKKVAVEACLLNFSQDNAFEEIAHYIKTYYQEKLGHENENDIEKAIHGVQQAFSQNIFPAMNVKWENYPDHISHFTSKGCFRCHDGQHISQEGQTITNRCSDCHIITAQGAADNLEVSNTREGLDFRHPIDIDLAWTEMPCYECHSTPPLEF